MHKALAQRRPHLWLRHDHDIIDGKVWIQHNSTEIAIDQELRDRGVAKEDIILGFRSPSLLALPAQASA